MSKNRTSKYMRQNQIKLQGEIDKFTITVTDFSKSLSAMNSSAGKKIRKDIDEFNSTISRLDIMNTYQLHPLRAEYRGAELQDGGRVRRGDHLLPHKYIRNTSTRGTAPTEHLLNTGRRPQTSQKARNSPRTWVGQKKKEKTEPKNRDGTCISGREL